MIPGSVLWRSVAWSTPIQPAASASGETRMKSGAICGGTACSMSNSVSTMVVAPSASARRNQARRAGPSTFTSVCWNCNCAR
jgi:hypothetical protein